MFILFTSEHFILFYRLTLHSFVHIINIFLVESFITKIQESIYLTNNGINGNIPWKTLSFMNHLNRFQLSRNGLEGSFPGDAMLPPKLEILGLGHNHLVGSLSDTLVLPTSMTYLNVPYNQLTGTLPELLWTETPLLEHVNFESNNLTGSIPSELLMNYLNSLETLLLNDNGLTGTIPQMVCTKQTIDIVVDCEYVSCSCCSSVNENCKDSSLLSNTTAATSSSIESTTAMPVATPVPLPIVIPVSGQLSPSIQMTIMAPVPAPVQAADIQVTTDSQAIPGIIMAPVPAPVKDIVPPITAVSPSTPALPSTGTEKLPLDLYSFPYVDDETMAVIAKEFMTNENNSANDVTLTDETAISPLPSSPNCRAIDVGFTCYDTAYSIDFVASNSNCGFDTIPGNSVSDANNDDPLKEYDLIALYPYNTTAADEILSVDNKEWESVVGTIKPLNASLYWATSCGLSDCDGVISSPGRIYYRNTHPMHMVSPSASKLSWPISGGSFFQLLWLRADSSGDAIVFAESRPFLVADRCL